VNCYTTYFFLRRPQLVSQRRRDSRAMNPTRSFATHEHLERRALAIAEDEYCPDEQIFLECFPAQTGQVINASA